MNNIMENIKIYNERLNPKNMRSDLYNEKSTSFGKYQDSVSTIKQNYIKNIMNIMSDNNESFIIKMNYIPNEKIINNNFFSVKILNKYGEELFSTTFEPKVIYFGFDIFEYLIRYFCKININKIKSSNYDDTRGLFTINTNNIELNAQIPRRYLETINLVCKCKRKIK